MNLLLYNNGIWGYALHYDARLLCLMLCEFCINGSMYKLWEKPSMFNVLKVVLLCS
ncbi:hypothetical protein Dtox_2631 [Desulfofarcimen acetoxidans DSM 771]|uniref:Uncharacterized protein n=1 Tax=Desulfofarcimen acetoxidans (strain ATCC 49208 / DSM 771 / KCTC 5769 / VKM B-1644 / 5575) TaxID=485916 RepID=C8W124_DESAS|nr:hypothetical protein Dtox_2631 [Desulfofarcimen acetoxidans DSM 771]